MHWIALFLLVVGQASPRAVQTDDGDSYLMGRPDSPVRIEMFSDFQCPSCRTFYLNTVTNLVKEYSAGSKVAFVFREFPLTAHVVARSAARYAVAAKVLGREKWVNVIEHLYISQAEWSYDGKIEPVLARILSPEEVQSVTRRLNDPAVEQSIDRDIARGNSRKVDSTPTVFVRIGDKEESFAGGLPFVTLRDYIERRLR
jgi:protein-disulfide isomerase